ncbi:hydrolase [Aphelenchoides avenae]|nr:hydrolase [Aphelenchus avenae]
MGTSVPLTCEEPAVNSSRVAKPWKKTNNGKRLRDANGYRLRAAGLCQRRTDDEMEVLLVSGRTNPNHWVIPGGGIEEAEAAERAVIREVEEEAGVKAEIVARVGEFIWVG